MSWITEGTAHRTRVRIDPVRHLLVHGTSGDSDDWVLWCSSGKGRKDSNPHCKKFCRECVHLANEAISEGTLDPDDVHGFPVTATAPDEEN